MNLLKYHLLTQKRLGDCSFKMAAAPAAVWNKLPPNNTRNEINFGKFKSSIKTYFFNLTYN